jgi:16S rRNA (uracil1498-N3)-methyltransferase
MSGFRRFFVDEINDETIIEGEEFKHAVGVLRVKVKDNIYLADGSGKEFIGEITAINKKDLTVKKIEEHINECEPKTDLTLICGYLKGDKTELVVQKAVELGVNKIVVFSSEYSSAFMNDNKLGRLKRVALEACKQCGRAKVPSVEYADTFSKALEFGNDSENKLFACEFAESNQANLSKMSGSTAIVIGSEGGFSVKESGLANELGYKTVYLGKRILRAETACIALTAIVMNALGELN